MLIIVSVASAGLEDKRFGVGFIIGDPTGLSFKKWISNTEAIDVAVAWSLKEKEKFTVQVDFLRHNFKEINIDNGEMPFFYGLGSRIEIESDNKSKFGIRGVGGIEYIFQTVPVEVFFEVGPVLELVPKTDISLTGGVGVRYYF